MQLTISSAVKEIRTVLQIGVFCVHTPGFLLPGHILYASYGRPYYRIAG